MPEQVNTSLKFVDINKLTQDVKNFQAGKVAHCLPEWQKLTSDVEVLQIAKGDIIEFEQDNVPSKHYAHPCSLSIEEKKAITSELHDLLDQNIIKLSHREQNEFVSSIFTRPKPNSSLRVIINLKPLNQFITSHHFKMDTIKTVLRQVTLGCYLATIDLKHTITL